ncbi:hypothetical protein KIN20_035385 [Parelaphostrongylus tenuis]|uniref:Uncharacterized protein n=1 Tax=Parelaphostrongylus tenuis TaxID=148309 RepID=A0AAD5WKE5_PARTN|nr:hypothetical protein KIN20_035385 [Parelaphostrongylus tenuis]
MCDKAAADSSPGSPVACLFALLAFRKEILTQYLGGKRFYEHNVHQFQLITTLPLEHSNTSTKSIFEFSPSIYCQFMWDPFERQTLLASLLENVPNRHWITIKLVNQHSATHR